ncbi:helicase-related protein [Nonomuraea ferruginea]
MLIGVKTDHAHLLGRVRAVVVDEVHAFAGDDRGWHLLAVLERLERVTGHPLQRIGLSATVGNPHQLLEWLQGAGAGKRTGQVVAPDLPPATTATVDPDVLGHAASSLNASLPAASRPAGDVELDYVGSLDNAAKLIATLHRGEKRLVFCDSRRQVEQLGAALRAREVNVFLSHASLSADERARSEQAFAEARDCVIVSTSTLELGIDVGDLDRVIQIDSPSTVASFLQRIGRTGRRARHRTQLPVPRNRGRIPSPGRGPAPAVGPQLGRTGHRTARTSPSGGAATARHHPPAAPDRRPDVAAGVERPGTLRPLSRSHRAAHGREGVPG